MKKPALGLFIILTLLLSYSAVFINFATANPVWIIGWPTEPITTPPTIAVYSPVQNETCHSSQATLNFTVIEPNTWFGKTGNGANTVFGKITAVYYVVDSGECQYVVANATLNFSIPLNLTSGVHTVQIGVEGNSYYVTNPLSSNPLSSVEVRAYSEPINFTVVYPEPVVVTPEKMTYNESSVPLAFSLGTSAASWVGYSLDGKGNVTLSGNTTLTGLSNGHHTVTVYANDTFGSSGSSQTINFTVAAADAKQEVNSLAVATVASALVAVAVVVVASLLYFKRRRLVG
jgi:hypothetical protein